jgi:hypothetical protein
MGSTVRDIHQPLQIPGGQRRRDRIRPDRWVTTTPTAAVRSDQIRSQLVHLDTHANLRNDLTAVAISFDDIGEYLKPRSVTYDRTS